MVSRETKSGLILSLAVWVALERELPGDLRVTGRGLEQNRESGVGTPTMCPPAPESPKQPILDHNLMSYNGLTAFRPNAIMRAETLGNRVSRKIRDPAGTFLVRPSSYLSERL